MKFLNIQALMCVALMSILYNVGTTIRSLTELETYPQVPNWVRDLPTRESALNKNKKLQELARQTADHA